MVHAAVHTEPINPNLSGNEETFRKLVELADDAMAIWKLDGTLTYLSPGFEKRFGFAASDWIGRHFLPLIHPDDVDHALSFNQVLIQTGVPQNGIQFRHAHQSGQWIWASINLAAIEDHQGIVVGIQGVMRDIDDLKQQQEKLQIQLNVLDQAHQDLKRAEVELQSREQQLRKINDYIPGVIYQYETNLTTYESRFTYMSPRSIDLFEYSAEAIVADENIIWAMMPPDDFNTIVASVTEATQHHTAWRDEFRILLPSGQVKWIQGQSDPDVSSVGVVRHNGVFLDITDRKIAEAKVQELADRQTVFNQISTQIRKSLDLEVIIHNALHSLRAFLKIDKVTFAWYQTDEDEPYWILEQESKSNDVFSALGRLPATVVGPIEEILFSKQILKVDDATQYPEPIHRAFLEQVECQSELLIPIITQTQRMGLLICVNHTNQHHWSHGEIEFLKAIGSQMAIAISQSELYQTSLQQQRQLQETLSELKRTQSQVIHSEKMSSLGHLVAGIAHEINNPVNFIHGNISHTATYAQDLLDLVERYQQDYPAPTAAIADHIDAIDLAFLQEDLPKTLRSMQMGTERIRDIVKSLRLFSRLDESDCKFVNIHEGIDSTLLILQNRIKGNRDRSPIIIHKNYADLPEIECLAGQLNQVFMNILVNAIDALEEGDRDRTITQQNDHPSCITITTRLDDTQQVSIEIQDNGPGVPVAIQSQIFDPFFTTKPVGKGTGMGMSISYQIVTEKHGGELILMSTPDHGTTFTIKIPCVMSVGRSHTQSIHHGNTSSPLTPNSGGT